MRTGLHALTASGAVSFSKQAVVISYHSVSNAKRPIRLIRYIVLVGGIFFGVILPGALDAIAQKGVPEGISLPTNLRVRDTTGWWPTKGSAAREQYVGNAECAKCHSSKAVSYEAAAMSHAAVRAEDSQLAQENSLELQLGRYRYQLPNLEGKSSLKVSDAKTSAAERLTWAFGVGHMGQTYLYEKDGSYYETHVSFYAAIKALDITPGQSRDVPASLETAVGRRMPSEEAQRCFGCHTTASTIKGQFDPSDLTPGVTCEACHGPGAEHVAAARSGIPGLSEALILNPRHMDRVDAVDFCGACHRTWEDVLTTGQGLGVFNVRFAPYRLENSDCWKQGDDRITCTACHDPHEPLSHDVGSYDATCRQCHSASSSKSSTGQAPAVCSVETKNCVTCHMPKYEPPGLHSSFTDHWIRVVRAHDSYPE